MGRFVISPHFRPESAIRKPEDLKGVPISVGCQSGSHYSTLQALEQYLEPADIKLSFADGILFSRMENLIDRKTPAAALFSGPYYFLEQLGFRKIIDSTFMIATLLTGDPDPQDVKKYFNALRRAQRDIDLRSGRAHRVRNLYPGIFRGLVQLDPRARHFPARRDGLREIRASLHTG